MSRITENLETFLAKAEKICTNPKNVNSKNYTEIIDSSLSLSFLIYEPEDAKLFQEKMEEFWQILIEKSHLENKDANEIISIIKEQLKQTSYPEEKLDNNFIKHAQKVIKKSTEKLDK